MTLYSKADSKVTPPFKKLFWEEQQKYLARSKTGQRYHPMIIKFCLAVTTKSSSAYSELRYDSQKGSGVLLSPSLRILRDYRNYIRPTRGFNPKVVRDLKEKTKEFSEQKRYVTILLDEIKIQDDLVWEKHTEELIGFVDLGDPDLKVTCNMKVIAAVTDGTSPNCKFFRMHLVSILFSWHFLKFLYIVYNFFNQFDKLLLAVVKQHQ